MAHKILTVQGIEGVTYTGGEPTVQACGLALLSERLRTAGLTVVSYTGYTLEALRARNDPWIERFLASVDILIDGPFVQAKAANLLWRGSRNQRIHFLSDTYRHLAEQVDQDPAQVEFAIDQECFLTTGTWPQGFLERLKEILEK
jgi:anaerobic ribonucleoside-triphosphate reductase activating protein